MQRSLEPLGGPSFPLSRHCGQLEAELGARHQTWLCPMAYSSRTIQWASASKVAPGAAPAWELAPPWVSSLRTVFLLPAQTQGPRARPWQVWCQACCGAGFFHILLERPTAAATGNENRAFRPEPAAAPSWDMSALLQGPRAEASSMRRQGGEGIMQRQAASAFRTLGWGHLGGTPRGHRESAPSHVRTPGWTWGPRGGKANSHS